MPKYTINVDIKQGRMLTGPLGAGMTLLGTISREPGDLGALVRTGIGQYVEINAGAVRTLHQGAATSAIIRAYMVEHKLSGAALAQQLNVSANTVSGWINYAKLPDAPTRELLRIKCPGIAL